MVDPYKIILEPIISEKSTMLQETENTYLFKVARDANKPTIKIAVEKLFEVDVQNIRTAIMPRKPKRQAMIEGQTPSWKKAYIRIEHGQSIPIFET